MIPIEENIHRALTNLKKASIRSNRDPNLVHLVAVTKGIPIELIQIGYNAGLRMMGESRVQEAIEKIKSLPGDIEWQLIGHLQTNKAKSACGIFKMIQSVDSIRLAEKLNQIAQEGGRKLDVLLEVNIGKEATKCGFLENEVESAVKKMREFQGLNLKGLMTIAPYDENLAKVRPFFKRMKVLFEEARGLEILSMGMSHDYEIAVEEGSTMVRIGEAIFGKRETMG